jgi:hypothetical protein
MEADVGVEELLKGLPLEERVPALALKNYHDQRSALDQEQEMQLVLIRRKFADRVKPLLDRVRIHSLRPLSSSKEAHQNRKKSLS